MSPSRIREYCGIALVASALLGACAHAADGAPVPPPAGDDRTVDATGIIFPLKSSGSLSSPGDQTDPKTLAEIRAEQAQFAALLRDEEVAKNPEAPVKAAPPNPASAEIGSLQAEANRIKQQTQSDKAALDAVGIEASTLKGFIVLGGLLLICLIAVGWALWHSHIVRKNELEDSWVRAHDDDLGATDLMLLEGNTEYVNTQFGNTEFVSTETRPIDLHTADFQTTGNYHTEVGHADNETSPSMGNLPLTAAPSAEPTQPKPVEDAIKKIKLLDRPFSYRRVEGDEVSWAFKFAARRADGNTAPQRAAKPIDPAQLRKANEIYDVMQLADSWMSVRDPVEVLETLEPFKDVELPESPIPWLCLLDVYRVLGDQEKYDAILKRIKKIFNVRMPPLALDAPVGEVQLRKLADYPTIVETILYLWEGDQIVPYLESLLVDNRDGTRDGFDLPVYRNILQLIAIANDPDRSKRHDQITHGKAYAILHSEPTRETTGIPSEAVAERNRTKFATTTQADETPLAKSVSTPEARLAQEVADAGTATTELRSGADAKLSEMLIQAEVPKPAINYDDMSSMSIKLHLAIAYQDIGDEEGARLLLDEVIKDGTVDQSEKAKLLLARLPSP